MPDPHVQISDFSDRELLAMIADLGLSVTPRDLALRIFGLRELEKNEDEIRRQSRCVVQRFAWMRRFGMVEKVPDTKPTEWRLSPAGEALRRARASATVTNGIEKSKEETGLAIANLVGERMNGAGAIAGQAMVRELTYQIRRRRTAVRARR